MEGEAGEVRKPTGKGGRVRRWVVLNSGAGRKKKKEKRKEKKATA